MSADHIRELTRDSTKIVTNVTEGMVDTASQVKDAVSAGLKDGQAGVEKTVFQKLYDGFISKCKDGLWAFATTPQISFPSLALFAAAVIYVWNKVTKPFRVAGKILRKFGNSLTQE